LKELQHTNEALLASGMTIQQMNIIRKRLEIGKGGRLAAAAYPSTVVTLVLSDILGDPLDLIASGPTVRDTSTCKDAWDLVKSNVSLQSSLSQAVLNALQEGLQEDVPLDVFQKSETILVGNNELAVMAAAEEAQRLGYYPVVLSTHIEGEALVSTQPWHSIWHVSVMGMYFLVWQNFRPPLLVEEKRLSRSWPEKGNKRAGVVEIRNWPWQRH
jgi:glycerate-2-kinase